MKIGFSDEPALWIAIIDAVLVLATTFGVPLTAEQHGAIDAVLAAIAGVLIRSQVSPIGPTPATPPAPPA